MMTSKPQARQAKSPVPAALDDETLDRIAGGADPSSPNVVYVGGSTRFATGKTGTGDLVGIDFRPS